jgi:hypothetical protein
MEMTKIEKRFDDLIDAIKSKRLMTDRVKVIEVIGDGWIETYNLTTGEITRIYDHEQDKQAA